MPLHAQTAKNLALIESEERFSADAGGRGCNISSVFLTIRDGIGLKESKIAYVILNIIYVTLQQ